MSRLTSPFAFLDRSKAASDDKDEDDKNKSKSKAEEKDDDDDKKDDGDEKKNEKDDDAKGKSKSKAEEKDDDKKDDDEDDDKSKSKKAKADGDDEDDEGDTSAKKARARERGRIRAILTSPAGQADPVAAAHVALDTAMPRADAIAMLTAMQLSRDAMAPAGGAPRASLGERMGGVSNPTVGSSGGPSNGLDMADRILAAGKKARGGA